MATVGLMVSYYRKDDGTYNVNIRVFHRKERKFIETSHYVSDKQLDDEFNIKDKHLLLILEKTLLDYRTEISSLGSKLNMMTCENLRDHLRDKDKEIEFIGFCTDHINTLREEKRDGSANNHRSVRNSLIDYFGRSSILIGEINSAMLFSYEKWLKTDRTMKRINQLGKEVVTIEKGMKAGGIYAHMRDLRTLFNEARRKYNNEDIGIIRIKHYPFSKYKIGAPPKTKKRNITAEQTVQLMRCNVPPGGRAELAKDLFTLSFYLCGMNAVDLYSIEKANIKNGRLEYNRSKTSGQRDDEAFISVRIVPEARDLLQRYIGTLKNRYSTYTGLDTALSKGMKQLQKLTGIPGMTFYSARHTFANIARNKCRMSKDDIAEALNHIDEEHKITDIYIEKDWSNVDLVQKSVIAYLKILMSKQLKSSGRAKEVCSEKRLEGPIQNREQLNNSELEPLGDRPVMRIVR